MQFQVVQPIEFQFYLSTKMTINRFVTVRFDGFRMDGGGRGGGVQEVQTSSIRGHAVNYRSLVIKYSSTSA